MLLSHARRKLAELTARLAYLNPTPARSAGGGKNITLSDLVSSDTYYPIVITYPNSKLFQSFVDKIGVAHLRDTDFMIYEDHHKKDL